ncbi:MAG: TonB-dependent receptor [Bacteroidetes bacterium]|nr:MAG: TonB-dependent receptor [Bacteroidota bacterium]
MAENTQILGVKQKALAINLDKRTYGTFAEIGAGQEVAAHFFKAGAASQTIAKTMSAYDMTFSDAIYGAEPGNRYVTQSRLLKMISREFGLLDERLTEKRGKETLFFAYANTLTTINFKKDNEGHGWMGIQFQLSPNTKPNECILHVRLLDNDANLQQQAVGTLGVNLIYACLYRNTNPEDIITTLTEEIDKGRIEIDMFRLKGPDFEHVDNRILALQLVKNKMTRSALFGPSGEVLQASDVFYKKNILAYRGRFRPFTLLNQDMYHRGIEQFKKEEGVTNENLITVAELTLFNLQSGSETGELNYKDFIDRVEILCSLGYTVLISDYQGYYRLASYLSRFTKNKIGIILGIYNLADIFSSNLYNKLKGGILEAFGMLFGGNAKLYVYPANNFETGNLYNCENFKTSKEVEHLFKHLKEQNKIEDIKHFDIDLLRIMSDDAFKMISTGKTGWENMVPPEVAATIKEKKLFGYN